MFYLWAFISVPIAITIHSIIEILYPGKITEYGAYYGWYVLEFCSRVEMKAQEFYAFLKIYAPYLQYQPRSFITLIRDGEEVEKYDFDDFMKMREKITPDGYDFFLYELPIIDNEKYDYCILRYKNPQDILKIEYSAIVDDFKFNAIQFKFQNSGNKYPLTFNKNQFIVKNNILFDMAFLKWYMNKYHTVIVDDNDNYMVSFMDQDMNYIELTKNNYIIIKQKSYEIITIPSIVDIYNEDICTGADEVSADDMHADEVSAEEPSSEDLSETESDVSDMIEINAEQETVI